MSVAEDFIGQMITETASGDRCEECGFLFDDPPGCQCKKKRIKKTICPYCNRKAEFADNAEIYGRSYGKSHHVWLCRPCNAYVGVHDNDPNRPLGTMANKELRDWRIKAHAAIDPIWKEKRMRRGEIYAWLKDYFRRDIHIGESDIEQCKNIVHAAFNLEKELDRQDDGDGSEDGYSYGVHPLDFGDS